MKPTPPERPLRWVGSAKKDFCAFPDEVQDDFGYALHLVQFGVNVVPGAKPLGKGVLKGLGVIELCDDHDGDTYRTVYTARLGRAVYVLDAFKKKSKRGIATPKHETDLIRQRYEAAERDARERGEL
ncbi:MAG TPA: type II toxin-antitoxin system RelE/ParE family toxin [Longimicrobium sp.]|nr:type II toxin-antitoxin system RelE/ParE family toxin [Longimicrobium sp.]